MKRHAAREADKNDAEDSWRRLLHAVSIRNRRESFGQEPLEKPNCTWHPNRWLSDPNGNMLEKVSAANPLHTLKVAKNHRITDIW